MAKNLNKNANTISLVAQYIYDHSDQHVTLDALASYTGFSKFHFNRLFFAATGFQLGEFIQRKKLEKSLHLIKQGNKNILDVALAVGYDSASSFTRAFKKNYLVTPSDVIRGKLPKNERAGSVPPKKQQANCILKPIWKTRPELNVYGLYGEGFDKQSFSSVAGKLFGRLGSMAEPLSYEELQPIGVSIDNPWIVEQEKSTFFAGFVNGLSEYESDLEVFHWQSGRWACFTHVGSHHNMWQTISQVYAQWV
jgi:AraC family transcriptional regulator